MAQEIQELQAKDVGNCPPNKHGFVENDRRMRTLFSSKHGAEVHATMLVGGRVFGILYSSLGNSEVLEIQRSV